MIRSIGLVAVALMGVAFISGCATQVGGKSLPVPSAGFQPTDVLPYAPARVYAASTAALDDASVPILSGNKDEGRIVTDYVAGPELVRVGGLLGGNSTRYKYLITIKASGSGSKLKVAATLESSGTQMQSWRDVSSDNQDVVNNIQNAMTENIEKHLKQ